MAQGRGTDVVIGAAVGVTWSTAPTVDAANAGLKVVEGTWKPNFKAEEIARADYNASQFRTQSTEVGNIDIDGSFELDLKYQGIDLIQAAFFGTDTKTGAGPYQHVLTSKKNMDGIFVGFEFWDGVSDYLIDSAKITKLGYRIRMGKIVRLMVSWVGRKVTLPGTSGLTSITEPAAIDYVQSYASIMTIQTAAQASSVAAFAIMDADIDFEREYDIAGARNSTHAPWIAEPRAGLAKCSGKVTIPHEAMTYFTAAGHSAGTASALYKFLFRHTKSSSLIHDIGIPSVKFLNTVQNPTGKAGINQELNWIGELASSTPSGLGAASPYVTITNSNSATFI